MARCRSGRNAVRPVEDGAIRTVAGRIRPFSTSTAPRHGDETESAKSAHHHAQSTYVSLVHAAHDIGFWQTTKGR